MAKSDKIELARPLPHNMDAERAVLGSVFLERSALSFVADKLKPEDFMSAAHQAIYRAMLNLFEQNIPIDLTTLSNELRTSQVLDKIGGLGYVAGLEEHSLIATQIEEYANIVIDKARLRRLIATNYEILETAYRDDQDVRDILETAEKKIFEISQDTVSGDFFSVSDLTISTMEDIERRYKDQHEVSGLRTNYTRLDSYLSGLQPSDLIVLAARPSKGKTAFGLNIALRIAVQFFKPVGVFSLEMSREQVNTRFLCTQARVSAQNVRTGKLSDHDWDRLREAARILSEAPLYVDDTPGLTALDVRAKARRLKSRVPDLSLLIVDYLQLMHSGGRIENRQQEVSEISRSLKALARELKIPIIAISQLSRMIEQRRGAEKKPMLSDLRESGAIEQDADVVLFIHHKEVEKPEGEEEEETSRSPASTISHKDAQIIIGKQRNGPLGEVDLIFFPDFMLFENQPEKYYRE